MIVIIDYGAGNLRSVVNAVKKLGYQPLVTNRPSDVVKGQAVVLPGVGAAGETMVNLKRSGMDAAIRQCISADHPFLGVCLGLQVLFNRTEEDNGYDCLGILSGQVKRLPAGQKIPHMGWNQVKQTITHPIFAGIPDMTNFYFVHSYYAVPSDLALTGGHTEYGVKFCSVVARGNLVATQFHPEKSGDPGLRIYNNFFKMAGVTA
jgi:imidazole glycerol-phosphate synthase subunit HisH